MTFRTASLVIALLMLGCARDNADALNLPAALPGGWTRGSARELSPEAVPAEIRALQLTRAFEADYQGPSPMKVIVYVMSSPAGAFEAMQKWRHREGALAFHEGRYLAVVDAPQASKAQLDSAADAVSKSLR